MIDQSVLNLLIYFLAQFYGTVQDGRKICR